MAITIDEKVNPESSFYSDKTILVAKTGWEILHSQNNDRRRSKKRTYIYSN